jgi:release factor glutamine methyltransferase
MSANLPLKMPHIKAWIDDATRQLIKAGIGTAKLDAELILAHTLRKPRTFLHAHGDTELTSRQYEIANARLYLRHDRTPLAYIIGHKEFYRRPFKVTPATLIPRPESESFLDLLQDILPNTKALLPDSSKRLVDVGTGSGILGITAKLEHPELDVTLVDISRHALNVARANAQSLDADIHVLESDLLSRYDFVADIILANLPYVDTEWERSPETNQEPPEALFAKDGGLYLIKKLIEQTDSKLRAKGYLLLEADPRQHSDIIRFAKAHNLTKLNTKGFVINFQKN